MVQKNARAHSDPCPLWFTEPQDKKAKEKYPWLLIGTLQSQSRCHPMSDSISEMIL